MKRASTQAICCRHCDAGCTLLWLPSCHSSVGTARARVCSYTCTIQTSAQGGINLRNTAVVHMGVGGGGVEKRLLLKLGSRQQQSTARKRCGARIYTTSHKHTRAYLYLIHMAPNRINTQQQLSPKATAAQQTHYNTTTAVPCQTTHLRGVGGGLGHVEGSRDVVEGGLEDVADHGHRRLGGHGRHRRAVAAPDAPDADDSNLNYADHKCVFTTDIGTLSLLHKRRRHRYKWCRCCFVPCRYALIRALVRIRTFSVHKFK